MSPNTPAVSVLIPVYNAEKTLRACIWSVLNQSFRDIEVIIALDGCTDNSERIAREFEDSRIRILVSERNRGIVATRNELVKAARCKFIAWNDADDISLPGRLATQHEYLEVHPDLKLLGSWVELRNNRQVKQVKWPTDKNILDAWMFFRNPFVQSSLMLRADNSIQYASEFEYLEDYQYCSTLLGMGTCAIYPEALCSYLEDDDKNRIDKYLRYDFVGKLEKIMAENFAKLDIFPGKNERSLIREFLRNSKRLKSSEYKIIRQFLFRVKAANEEKRLLAKSALSGVVAYQMLRIGKSGMNMMPSIIWYFLWRPRCLYLAWKCRIKIYS